MKGKTGGNLSVVLESPVSYKGTREDYASQAAVYLVCTGDLQPLWEGDSIRFVDARYTSQILRALAAFEAERGSTFCLGVRSRVLRPAASDESKSLRPELVASKKIVAQPRARRSTRVPAEMVSTSIVAKKKDSQKKPKPKKSNTPAALPPPPRQDEQSTEMAQMSAMVCCFLVSTHKITYKTFFFGFDYGI